jgi:hypothetical protein
MGVIKAGDPPGRLPHREAVALIDSERLVDRLHPWSLRTFLSLLESHLCQAKAFRCFSMKFGTERAGLPVIFSTISLVPAKIPSL